MKNGIIYFIFKSIVKILYCLNIVELFKYLFSRFFNSNEKDSKILAIDIFIILKWIFIISLLIWQINGLILTLLVIYLIFMNLFIYFYYHVWEEPYSFLIDKIRKRFLNLILAICFSIFCYYYLILVPFKKHFIFENEFFNNFSTFLYSISNAFLINYDQIQPSDNFGYFIIISESLITFIFFTIILSKTFHEPIKE